MRALFRERSVRTALLLLCCYAAAVFLGNLLSGSMGAPYMGHCLTLTVLLVAWLLFLPRTGLASGFRKPKKRSAVNSMYYLPPLFVVLFCYGMFDETLTGSAVLCLFVTAVLAALLQESALRGILYPGLREYGVRTLWCLILSGLSFCLDGVLFPVANDSSLQLICRLLIGFSSGVMTAALYELTQSVIPGTAFHALLLAAQLMTVETDDISSTGPAFAVLLINLLFAYYLFSRRSKMHRVRDGWLARWLRRRRAGRP